MADEVSGGTDREVAPSAGLRADVAPGLRLVAARGSSDDRLGFASRRRAHVAAVLFFDVASPYTYLTAERADRSIKGLRWVPAYSAALRRGPSIDDDDEQAALKERARLLRLPLFLPLVPAVHCVRAMRVASLAAERGCAAAFVLAATRLMFCAGFDIEDPAILVEAGDFADIARLDVCIAAADTRRDRAIADVGRTLVAAGVYDLPAIRVGRSLFSGEDAVAAAVAAGATG